MDGRNPVPCSAGRGLARSPGLLSTLLEKAEGKIIHWTQAAALTVGDFAFA